MHLSRMVEYPQDWDERRLKVLRRDMFTCVKCKAKNVQLHVHHVVPLSRDGSNRLENLTTLCKRCHEHTHPHMIFSKIVRWMWLIGILLFFPGMLLFVVTEFPVFMAIALLGMLIFSIGVMFKIIQIKFFVTRKRFRKARREWGFD